MFAKHYSGSGSNAIKNCVIGGSVAAIAICTYIMTMPNLDMQSSPASQIWITFSYMTLEMTAVTKSVAIPLLYLNPLQTVFSITSRANSSSPLKKPTGS